MVEPIVTSKAGKNNTFETHYPIMVYESTPDTISVGVCVTKYDNSPALASHPMRSCR